VRVCACVCSTYVCICIYLNKQVSSRSIKECKFIFVLMPLHAQNLTYASPFTKSNGDQSFRVACSEINVQFAFVRYAVFTLCRGEFVLMFCLRNGHTAPSNTCVLVFCFTPKELFDRCNRKVA
jgi:hypothetical protein